MKVKEFFATVKKSVWDKAFYGELATKPLKDGFRYFFSLILTLALIKIIYISVVFVPITIKGSQYLTDLAINKYPSDLVINFHNGLASTTVSRVYKWSIPSASPAFFGKEPNLNFNGVNLENILVIDTSQKFNNIDQFLHYKTLVLVTSDASVVVKNSGLQIQPFSSNLNFQVTKPLVEKWTVTVSSWLKYIIPVVIVFGMIGAFIFSSISYLTLVFIIALFMKLIVAMAKKNGSYKQLFSVALYAVTASVIIDLIMFILGFQTLSWLLVIIITLLVWVLNSKVFGENKTEAVPPPVSPPPVS